MRGTFDLSPLHRFTVGFDRMSRLLDAAAHLDDSASSYPPYNIEKRGDDAYRVTLAVAGFRDGDLSITVDDNTLLIAGRIDTGGDAPTTAPEYLHRGIAARAFERRFQLADHIKVVAANLVDGLLHVDLVREVPEEKKPRTIAITTGTGTGTAEATTGGRALPHQGSEAGAPRAA
jgi:molecular chaperone IbpA